MSARLAVSLGRPPRPGARLAPWVLVLDAGDGALRASYRLPSVGGPVDGDQATAPWWDGERLIQPTRAAVLGLDPRTGDLETRFSHPWLHDVHSVRPDGDGWLVTCTGHQTVARFDAGGALRDHWHLGPRPPPGDLRRRPHDAFKPHAYHPNLAFRDASGVWTTCLMSGDCRGLDHDRRVRVAETLVHDGILREGRRWFTTVTGQVIGVTWPDGVDRVVFEAGDGPEAPGWCRGVEVLSERIVVGWSQLRRSRLVEWAGRAVRGPKAPSRVVALDRATGRVAWTTVLGAEASIYAITALSDP